MFFRINSKEGESLVLNPVIQEHFKADTSQTKKSLAINSKTTMRAISPSNFFGILDLTSKTKFSKSTFPIKQTQDLEKNSSYEVLIRNINNHCLLM